MNNEDKEIIEYNDRFMKKVLKSALYTFFIFLVTIFGVYFIVNLIFHDNDDFAITISFFVSIIFTIFFCMITIIEEIRKTR